LFAEIISNFYVNR